MAGAEPRHHRVRGALAIGLIVFSLPGETKLDPRVVLLLKVGICGGFTTFSSFALETFELLQKGAVAAAVLYAVLSVLLGVGAVLAAKVLAG